MAPSVGDYMAQFDGPIRERLEAIRALIHEAVPEAEEGDAYGIPEFLIDGKPALWVGAFAKHISLYPVRLLPPGLEQEAAPYLHGKATAKFAHTEPLPLDLIERLLRQMATNARQGLA